LQSNGRVKVSRHLVRKMSAAVAVAAGHGLCVLALSAPRAPFPPTSPAIEVVLVQSPSGSAPHAVSASSGASKDLISDPRQPESIAGLSDQTDQKTVSPAPGGRSQSRAAESGPGFSEVSPWTVAPSEKYAPENLGRELDCSTSNNASVWRNRSRACPGETTPQQTELLRDRHETVMTDRARSVKLKP
jgi:hypothetical protein